MRTDRHEDWSELILQKSQKGWEIIHHARLAGDLSAYAKVVDIHEVVISRS
jgi:hypothetical protein